MAYDSFVDDDRRRRRATTGTAASIAHPRDHDTATLHVVGESVSVHPSPEQAPKQGTPPTAVATAVGAGVTATAVLLYKLRHIFK